MFTHLHTHTEYSLLDGLCRIGPMVERCRELGMDALAITDHGAMYGAIEFYQACREAGVKPILGCEVYLARGSRLSRTPADRNPYHLTLLARDGSGYKNLIQLVTTAHLDGFYYRPRVDRDLLARHRQGIVALSGCLNGPLASPLVQGQAQEALEAALWFRETFGQDFYLELQRHQGIPELDAANKALLEIHRSTGIPLAATNDFHYVRREDADLQDIRICISTNTTVNDEKRLRMAGDSFYLKGPQEMADLFQDLPEAVANTGRIAESCDVQIGFDRVRLPRYSTPDGSEAHAFLGRLCREGLARRRPGAPSRYQERLRYELEVIRQTEFDNYFLVVWDIVTFARGAGILFGVRGSAAASLVLYCLGVTDVDPLEYGLVFERFLNLERKEMPDIDMDFQDDRRDQVIQHVVQKYGQDHVAQIITFGTLGPRAAIRDVGRALAMPYADVDRVARLIPPRARTLEEAMAASPELKALGDADATLHRLVETARRMEGLVHHASTHAAGVVIAEEPLAEYVPLQRPLHNEEGETPMTQFSMEPIARLGLLKMDVLGLANLTILGRAIELVEAHQGLHLELHRIPLDDQRTFDLLASGETADVFQLEGAGMRRYIRELKPTSLRDIAAMVALYRPGPMEQIDRYIGAKHGREEIRYPHPDLRELLEETYGVIVYQDQVLFIVQRLAGYSLGQADIVRKAMGKKVPEIMAMERERFTAGALERGYTRQEAEEVFHLIEPFAGYAFNKAHSVSYALIAYWTAFFKASYPVEYMTAVLNTRAGNMEKVASTVAECHRLKVTVLPPDVSRSQVGFSIEPLDGGGYGIRFGLGAVKNVGDAAVEPIVQERERGGPFRDVADLCQRVDLRRVNRRTLESLVKVGALDSLGQERAALLGGLDRMVRTSGQQAQSRQTGQATMFDLFGQAVDAPAPALELARTEPASPRERLAWERELLGVAFSDNPFSQVLARVDAATAVISTHDLDGEQDGRRITLVGQVASTRVASTRAGRPFLAASLALMDGAVEVVAWADTYEESRDLWREGEFLRVVGRVRLRNDQLSVHCEEVRPYALPGPEPAAAPSPPQEPQRPLAAANGGPAHGPRGGVNGDGPRRMRILFQETSAPQEDEQALREALRLLLEFPGQDRVVLEVRTGGRAVRLDAAITADCGPDLQARLVELLGEGSVEMLRG